MNMVNSMKQPREAMPEEMWKGMAKEVGVFPARLEEILKAVKKTQFPPYKELV